MTFTALTLASFFANDRGADASDCFDAAPILSEIAAQAHNVPRDCLLSVNDQFGGCVNQMLDVQLGDILGAAWSKTAEVYEALASSRDSSTEGQPVSLLDHEISSAHRPSIKMYYGHALVARIDFEVELSLQFKAVKLLIHNGRIEEVQTGSCSGAAELKWNKMVLVRGETRHIDLPGKISLAH
jgi:hypothetical protein